MAGSLRNLVFDRMSDVTECSICTDIFTDPKSLPCLHSFCLQCLENYGKANKPGDQMSCPICRTNFVIPNGGFCNLPNNFFIGKIVEIRKLSSTVTSEVFCATCPEDGRVKAKMFCSECEQNLCERCGTSHTKIKFCQTHQVLEIGDKLKEVNLRNTCCHHHPGELVKMYCEDDKATICFLCFAESHQTHKCLSVAKASEEFSSALKNDLEAVKLRIPECKDSFEKLNKLKTDLLATTAEVEKDIINEATKLKSLIDTHAEVLMQNLTARKAKKLKEIENTQQDVERFEATIESYTRYLDELLKKGAPGDICREANQMKIRARELNSLPENCCGCDCCWDKIILKSANLEDVLRMNRIANVIGDVQLGSSNYQLLGHAKFVSSALGLLSMTPKDARITARIDKQSRAITVLNVPADIPADTLWMLFGSRRYGGGSIETIIQKNETATIIFKDSTVADGLASKGFLSFKGNRLLIKKLWKLHVCRDPRRRLRFYKRY